MRNRDIEKFDKQLASLATKTNVYEHSLMYGLSVRVTKTGKKVFQGRYSVGGKRKRHDHGYYPILSVKKAFELHTTMQNQIDEGLNPFCRSISTCIDLFDQWYEVIGMTRKDPSGARVLIDADISKVIGQIKLQKLKKREVMNMIRAIQKRGSNTQAERVRVLCKQVFKWGVQNDYLEKNPIADITGSAIGYRYTPRDRFLNDEEIGCIWNQLDLSDMSVSTVNALRLMLLTGLRRSEPILAKWADIDYQNEIWTIPAANNKSNRKNQIMLTEMMVRILKNQKDFCEMLGGSDWVFPSFTDLNQHMDVLSVTKAVRRHCQRQFWIDSIGNPIPAWTPHALRDTFETKLTEIGIDYVTMKKMLNHAIGGMSDVYNHAQLNDKKRDALLRWESKIVKLGKNYA